MFSLRNCGRDNSSTHIMSWVSILSEMVWLRRHDQIIVYRFEWFITVRYRSAKFTVESSLRYSKKLRKISLLTKRPSRKYPFVINYSIVVEDNARNNFHVWPDLACFSQSRIFKNLIEITENSFRAIYLSAPIITCLSKSGGLAN